MLTASTCQLPPPRYGPALAEAADQLGAVAGEGGVLLASDVHTALARVVSLPLADEALDAFAAWLTETGLAAPDATAANTMRRWMPRQRRTTVEHLLCLAGGRL